MALLLALPGVLTLYFAFNSGGMFEVTTAFGALVVLVASSVAVAVAPWPLAGLSRSGMLACGLLALFALWTLLSARWSHAGGRSLVAFDRVLLYLAILALFACIPRTEERFRWLLRGLLAGSAVVALIALTSRLEPSLWPTATGLVGDRLNYPLTYWNTLALLVGMACILAVHHTSDEREPAAIRICAAALLPPLAATLLLTFSRGALAVTVLGILVYLIAARPRGLLGGFLAAAVPTAIALSQTYSAQLIHEGTPLLPAAVDQGHRLTLILVACAIGAAILRGLALALDSRVAALPLSTPRWQRGGRIAAAATAALVLVAFLAAGGPSALHGQYDKFVNNTHEVSVAGAGQRSRLLDVSNDGRRPLWEVARGAYRQDPLRGTGAGTYQLQWQRHRSEGPERLYAYSLYLEQLGELGLIGLILVVGGLLTVLIGIGRRMYGTGRAPYAAAFALVLAWVVHAGVDIDWQSPAVCVPVFALGGLALANPKELSRHQWGERRHLPEASILAGATSGWLRPVLALACLAVAVIPARMALAQTHLHDSVEALGGGDCRGAQTSAHDAISTFDTGARAYEVLAMCAARNRHAGASVRWAQAAVSHDPASWEPHFVLALAQGAAKRDPRPEMKAAAIADPGREMLDEAVAAVRGSHPKRWRKAARTLPFAME